MKEYHLTKEEYYSIFPKDRNGKYVIKDHATVYCKEGGFHREDGPACEASNGTKSWIVNNYFHRLDGPAVERTDGYVEYWIDGECFSSKEEYDQAIVEIYLRKNKLDNYI